MMDKPVSPQKNDKFFENVARLVEQARRFVSRTIDLTMCATNFEVGRMIVEKEQDGESRAEYGSKLLAGLSDYLGAQFGKGFSAANLRNARQFYLVYSDAVKQSLTAGPEKQKRQSVISVFEGRNVDPIHQSVISESYPFRLSWTHCVTSTIQVTPWPSTLSRYSPPTARRQ